MFRKKTPLPSQADKLNAARELLKGGTPLKLALEKEGLTVRDYASYVITSNPDLAQKVGGKRHKLRTPENTATEIDKLMQRLNYK